MKIPKFVEFERSQYSVISITQSAFKDNDIKKLTFPNDSKVEIFESYCFTDAKIQKLQIPGSLKIIQDGCFDWTKNLCSIEVSKQNQIFLFMDKKYLVGKSDINNDKYDVLYYVKNDIKKAVIPNDVKYIKSWAILNKPNLKELQFQENPEFKINGPNMFSNNPIQKLIIPENITEIDSSNFNNICALTKLQLSSKNTNFIYLENSFLLSKSGEGVFDKLIFARRDVEVVNVPDYVKEIGCYAFYYCKKMRSLSFNQNSKFEIINPFAFAFIFRN